jgi:predicted ribosome quality control (RQC) complex YloA/Tae2 family protein
MDNFLLHAITQELAATLTGRHLGKVYQLGVTDLACDFQVRDGRWLMATTDPQRLALYLTARPVRQHETEARNDTAFPALIKKYLGGARVESIEKLGYDRVVRFDCSIKEEDGALVRRSLVFSLTGRSANVFLLEGAHILATLRSLASGAPDQYQDPAPPVDKLDPFQLSPELLDKLLAQHAGDLMVTAHQKLLGFTALYAQELARRAATHPPHAALTGLLADLFERPPQPALYSSAPLEELKRDLGSAEFVVTLAPIALLNAPAPFEQSFPTVNQAADVCLALLEERRNFLALRQQLQTQLNAKLKKQRTLLQNLTRERDGFSRGETQQRYGELLLANLQQAQKTAAGFMVTDFYDAEMPQLEIPAANQPTPQAAAEHYFKLARKARHGLQSLSARLPQVAAEIATTENQLARLATFNQRAELEAFALQTGLRKPPAAPAKPSGKPRSKAKPEKISGMRRYRSSDGYEMLVGRTDRDNDTLTFRVAKSFDLWFHVADYPGSHVLLRNPQRQPVPVRTITEAAQLAAQFSHARHDARVAVNYCERKFVSKQKGFAPGQVRLSTFKTIMVEPHEAGERLLD